jgi:plasmid stabilization system protein ParE
MSFRVVLRPEADLDIADAAAWYENERTGLGGEFAEAVFQAIDALAINPLLTSRRHRRRNIRCTIPARFPFRIIYEVANDTVLIICVIHSARDDRHWRQRLGGE